MIVKLTGGLGNTFFQYAFGRALSLERNLPVKFCWQRATRDYELDKYNAKVELVERPVGVPVYDEPSNRFDYGVYTAPTNSFYRGYWQSEKYFEKYADIIRQELTLKEPIKIDVENWGKKLQQQNSVFLHFRRGDYLNGETKEYHGVLSEKYYLEAMNHIKKSIDNPRFYIFSDDPAWCNNELPYEVISNHTTNQHEDLYLMMQCRHAVIANSSFSWFGAWLGKDQSDKIIIAPQNWFNNAEIDTFDMIPKHWIRL